MAPRQQYMTLPLNRETELPFDGGYKCLACGLEGLTYGEPHRAHAGHVCEPHPEGGEILAVAPYAGGPVARITAKPGTEPVAESETSSSEGYERRKQYELSVLRDAQAA